MKKPIKTNGFSLVEMAVVITIMAVIMGGTLAVSIKKKESSRISETEEKIAFIMKAIDNYVDRYNSLPCPALPELVFSNLNFGFADATAACGHSTLLSSTTNNIEAGIIPVYTLNIPTSYVFDAWNRRFTYIVDSDLTTSGGYSSDDGDIVVRNLNMGATFLAGGTGAAVMVISHGENGHGAWLGAGGPTRVDIGIADTTAEGDNAHVVSPLAYNSTFTQSIRVSSFDDIVRYKTKWQLTPN